MNDFPRANLPFRPRCRLCVCPSENLVSVSSILDDRPLKETILTLVGVKVQPGDFFPTTICTNCAQFINNFKAFQQICLDNQLELGQQFNFRNIRDGSDDAIKTEPVDHDTIVTPVITNMETEPYQTERPRRSSIPKCDEKEKIEKVTKPMSKQKTRVIICPFCSKDYPTDGQMLSHHKRLHAADNTSDNSLYHCPDCGDMFSTDGWEKHKKTHKEKKCEQCGKKFQFEAKLNDHISKTHSNKSRISNDSNSDYNTLILCKICDTLFRKEDLKEHKLMHEEMSAKNSEVDDTKPKSNPAHSSLHDRNKKKHSENKTSRNLGSDLAISPTQRSRSVSPSDVIPIRCEHCKVIFPNQTILEKHMDRDHILFTYPCETCGKTFRRSTALEGHKKVCTTAT